MNTKDTTISYSNAITIETEIVELLGKEINVYTTINEKPFVLNTSPANEVGEKAKISIYFDLNKLHFFKADGNLIK